MLNAFFTTATLSNILTFGYAAIFISIPVFACVKMLRSFPVMTTSSLLILIWIFPLLLLVNPMGVIENDYLSHVGQIAVLAQQIKQGNFLPHVTSSFVLMGDPTVSFYGRLYYIFSGYLSVFLGPHIAIRLVILAVSAIQVVTLWLCFKTYSQHCGRKSLAIVLTAIAYWSTYMMNSLYIRGAVAEFIATNILVSIVALMMLLWHAREDQKIGFRVAIILCYSFVILTHPLTAAWGTMVMLLVALGLLLSFGRSSITVKDIELIFLGTFIISFSWVYLMFLFPPSQAAISRSFMLLRFPGADIAWLRALPFPLSRVSAAKGYFVTQINSVLFVLSCITLIYYFAKNMLTRRAVVASVFLLLSVFLFAVSVNSFFDAFLPKFLSASQFAFRLVTYINLFMIVAMTLLVFDMHKSSVRLFIPLCMLATIVAMIGVGMNLFQMSAGTTYEGKHWWSLQSFEPEWKDYPYLKFSPTPEEIARFNVSPGCLYAQLPPVSIYGAGNVCNAFYIGLYLDPTKAEASTIIPPRKSNTSAWLKTDVVFHPWNQLTLNDNPVEFGHYQWFYKVKIPPSGGVLRYKTVPDFLYLLLDRVSFIVFIGLLLFLIYHVSQTRIKRKF